MYSGEYDACDVTLSVYPQCYSEGISTYVTLSVYPQCYSECISTYVTLSVYPWSGIFSSLPGVDIHSE